MSTQSILPQQISQNAQNIKFWQTGYKRSFPQCLDQEDIHNGNQFFFRYIDIKTHGEGLEKKTYSPPPPHLGSTTLTLLVLVQVVAATEVKSCNTTTLQHCETVLNMTPENKEHFLSEKEGIFLLLTGIGDDIYSTVMLVNSRMRGWLAIDRIHQGWIIERTRCKDQSVLGIWEVYFSRWRINGVVLLTVL
ncbi:hypothetical protein Tco_1254734 [Tanacetum coccineum]